MRTLTLVVSTDPARGDLERAFALARAARAAGSEVALFVMDRAVGGLPAARAAVEGLHELGCDLAACATSATAFGLGEAEVGMLLGSQDDHAAMVHRADRVLAFT
jgi:sulfur relay (sulfurtransferase) complex TusBCD TusD component (DsrE family)